MHMYHLQKTPEEIALLTGCSKGIVTEILVKDKENT